MFEYKAASYVHSIHNNVNTNVDMNVDTTNYSYQGMTYVASEVLAGKRPLTVQMIREISMGLGISADVLVSDSNPAEAKPINDTVDADVDWNRFPFKEMDRHGYFNEVPQRSTRALSELARDFVTRIIPSGGGSPILARQGLRGAGCGRAPAGSCCSVSRWLHRRRGAVPR